MALHRLYNCFLAIFCLLAVPTLAADMPKFTLPWGTWQATKYDSNGKFYTFKNVRFAKAPVGDLRFQKPVFPDPVSTSTAVQPNTASACYAATPSACSTTNGMSAATPTGGLLPKQPGGMDEDCLFADMYVPASAINNPKKPLPVVVWLYGGAFVFGAKDSPDNLPFYDPTGLLTTGNQEGNEMIFVTGNYRLGAFGWLAGPDMKANGGIANAGLWDQRLLIQFVSQYIGQLGGDPKQISAWGESAGAGSIMHHLISEEAPLFSKVVMQSPAYLWQWNPTSTGYAASMYNDLAQNCNCSGTSDEVFKCLQNKDAESLQDCNVAVVVDEWQSTGLSPFGPTIDGTLIKNLPPVALRNGPKWPSVTSFIISHVFDESKLFVPCYVTTDDGFSRFLDDFMPGDIYTPQKNAINQKYDVITDQKERAKAVIGDSSFYCNTRFVYDAYAQLKTAGVYMLKYEFFATFGAAVHASDLLPTFYSPSINVTALKYYLHQRTGISDTLLGQFIDRLPELAWEYQSYLTSFASLGLPKPAIDEAHDTMVAWNSATVGSSGNLENVMDASFHFFGPDFTFPHTDTQNSNATCWFWSNMSQWLENTAEPGFNGNPVLWLQHGAIKADL